MLHYRCADPSVLALYETHDESDVLTGRMLAAVGHPVLELVRRQFGPLHLGTLPMGRTREITRVELGELLTIARKSDVGTERPSEDSGE